MAWVRGGGTVVFRLHAEARVAAESLLVRASAQYQMEPVENPETYQDFFTALEKSMFLAAQGVD